MYFTKFQDFDPKGEIKTCKNASFDCHLNFINSCLFVQRDRQEPIGFCGRLFHHCLPNEYHAYW